MGFATDADVREYAVGLALPDTAVLAPVLARADRWAQRLIDATGAALTPVVLSAARDAACAYVLHVLAGNGLLQAAAVADSVKIGPLEFRLKATAPRVKTADEWLLEAEGHLVDAGVTADVDVEVSIVTAPRRRW